MVFIGTGGLFAYRGFIDQTPDSEQTPLPNVPPQNLSEFYSKRKLIEKIMGPAMVAFGAYFAFLGNSLHKSVDKEDRHK